MLVKERMSKNPVTIGPEANVDQALALMRQKGVRHLPVLDAAGRMVGLVNDIELRTAWFPSLLDELKVKDVMVNDPLVIQADDTVYQAARLLHHHKLTGLPVLEGDTLAGIITLADVLGLFVEIMGLLGETVRLDLALRPGRDTLEQVYSLLRTQGVEVVSVALIAAQRDRRVYSLRLDTTDATESVAALRAAGIEVLP